MNIFEKLSKNPLKLDESTNISLDEQEELDTPKDKNVFEYLSSKKKDEKDDFGFLYTLKDIGQQVLSKGASGIGGAYGNILDTLGLQLKEGETTPGQKLKSKLEFDILEKLDRGEVPSLGEFMLLSDDEYPTYSRLPTSKEIQKVIENTTGVGEGKTPEGRIAGRASEFIGEGIPTGGNVKGLVALGLSGGLGQTIRETEGPESLATTAEIVGPILQGGISKKLIPSSEEAKDVVKAGRKLGLSEQQITPLIQGEKKTATLSKIARKGGKTKELFASIREKVGDHYNILKSSPEAKIPISNESVIKVGQDFADILENLSKTIKPSPDKESALKFIDEAIQNLNKIEVTPEHLMNFWQDINKTVKWGSIQGGKKALTQLKKPITSALRKADPELARNFESANLLYSKYADIAKKLKPDVVDAFLSKGELLASGPAAIALVQGNPWALAGLGSEVALRTLSREMLVNPYFQDIAKKLVVNFNNASMKGIEELVKQTKEYLTRKHPQEDWEFLDKL